MVLAYDFEIDLVGGSGTLYFPDFSMAMTVPFGADGGAVLTPTRGAGQAHQPLR